MQAMQRHLSLRFTVLWLSMFVSLLGLGVAARAEVPQACDIASVQASTPASRFIAEDDGTTVDQLTQLMWMRCPLGQSWSGQACNGEAVRMNWQGSLAEAERMNRTGSHFYNDWRVPSLRELATVAERQCTRPRINLMVFPGTPAAGFWTSTASLQDKGQVYSLDFDTGGIRQVANDVSLHVRLVRSAP